MGKDFNTPAQIVVKALVWIIILGTVLCSCLQLSGLPKFGRSYRRIK